MLRDDNNASTTPTTVWSREPIKPNSPPDEDVDEEEYWTITLTCVSPSPDSISCRRSGETLLAMTVELLAPRTVGWLRSKHAGASEIIRARAVKRLNTVGRFIPI